MWRILFKRYMEYTWFLHCNGWSIYVDNRYIVGLFILDISKIQLDGNANGLSSLRALRILRPLKTVKNVAGLRSIMSTLVESMGALGDTIIVLFFVFLIFAISGVQVSKYNNW